MLHEQIAMALGITRDTLRKHYQEELTVVAMRRRAEVMQAQYQAATKKGSTTAARVYLANEPEFDVPPAPAGETPAPPAPARAPKLGKKEQATADAHTAGQGTVWDDLLPKGTPLQ